MKVKAAGVCHSDLHPAQDDWPTRTPLVLGHNYHAIHHLWPNLPWHRYRGVFRERLDWLERHGVPIEHRVFQRMCQGCAGPIHD